MQRVIRVWKEGLINYDMAWKLQRSLVARHVNCESPQDTVLIVEHPPVYTIGIRSAQYGEAEELKLRALGAEFYRTNRGGLITFHGPGQIVMYPIINLKTFGIGVRQYICLLERAVISTCSTLGIKNVRTSKEPGETGVWVGNSKICALGVHASRHITSHGLALNCNTDLSWYQHIVPCGLVGRGVTSLTRELSNNITTDDVIPVLLDDFCKLFNCAAVNYPDDEKTSLRKTLIDGSLK